MNYAAEGLFVFLLQAEDSIRVYKVTGVQTCALPIWASGLRGPRIVVARRHSDHGFDARRHVAVARVGLEQSVQRLHPELLLRIGRAAAVEDLVEIGRASCRASG